MSCAPPRPLRAIFLVTALLGGLGGVGCNTPHSPSFTSKAAGVTPAEAAAAAAATPRPLPEGTAEGTPEHLLNEYAGRDVAPDAEIATWDLPTKAKRVVVELLILAARDEPARLNRILTEQARWGVPDRREYDARPVFADDNGRAFLDVLRNTAARFARKQNLTCPPIMPPAAQTYVRNGSEPMWCFYGSNDGLDILAFKILLEGGHARIDYVGMHPERPTGMIPRPGPQPPPMTPVVRRAPGGMGGMDRLPPGILPGDPNAQPGQPGGPIVIQPGQPGDPNGAQAGQPGQPAAGQPGQPAAGQPGQPAAGQPGQPAAGQPGQPGQPAAGQPGQPAAGQPGQPGQPAAGQPTTPLPDPHAQIGKPATKKPATPRPAKPATEPKPAGAPAEAAPPAP